LLREKLSFAMTPCDRRKSRDKKALWKSCVLLVDKSFFGDKSVDKGRHSGQKFLISQFCQSWPKELWHSISRSSRSTCRTETEPQGEVDEEERDLARGTEPPNGQRSSVRGSPSTNDVKCQPSNGDLSDTGQRKMRLRRPRGAGEFRLTGHSGFSAF
jgi:hypothetical protein